MGQYGMHHAYESGHHEIGGAEPHGAHIDAPHVIPPQHLPQVHEDLHVQVHPLAHPVAHVVPHANPEMAPHDAQPIHSASTEIHRSSTPEYYDEMFGSHTNAYTDDWNPAYGAHHPEVAVQAKQNLTPRGSPDIGHLDTTPYEHAHSDYESRYLEHDVVPHHEVPHDVHGIQDHSLPVLPSYEELLWAYQHGGFHHGDAEGEVHHEDVWADESHHPHGEFAHQIDHPYFEEHRADHEYVRDHGVMHPAAQHYADQHEDWRTHPDWQAEAAPHEARHFEDPHHHEGGPYHRGDHYDDHHKTDEDFRHDTLAHSYHPGDTYGHDVTYHGGAQIMHDIEHQYDQLFHEIEAQTKHGVEHTDVHYKTLPLDRKDH
jgi:hypothetical protein